MTTSTQPPEPAPHAHPPTDWLGLVEDRRVAIAADNEMDGLPPPTEEEVLVQVIYEAITNFVERGTLWDQAALCRDMLDDPDYDLDSDAVKWVETIGWRR